MEQQNIGILERIHASYYQLTATERKVADYVLAHSSQVQFMSITQLADECGTADATISRFCRSLQLKGFNAFKLELAQHAATVQKSDFGDASDANTDTLEGRCKETGRMAQEAVSQTIELVDPELIGKTVSLLEKANHVYCMGSGGSMIIAMECAHLFSTVTDKFHAVSDSHLQMSTAAIMDPGDVILLFSYSGATTGGVQILELAKQRGVHTVLVTRFPKSPAAKLAEIVLRCGSNESPMQIGSVCAKVAQLVIQDLLYQEYFHRNRKVCEKNLKRIADSLSRMHI